MPGHTVAFHLSGLCPCMKGTHTHSLCILICLKQHNSWATAYPPCCQNLPPTDNSEYYSLISMVHLGCSGPNWAAFWAAFIGPWIRTVLCLHKERSQDQPGNSLGHYFVPRDPGMYVGLMTLLQVYCPSRSWTEAHSGRAPGCSYSVHILQTHLGWEAWGLFFIC